MVKQDYFSVGSFLFKEAVEWNNHAPYTLDKLQHSPIQRDLLYHTIARLASYLLLLVPFVERPLWEWSAVTPISTTPYLSKGVTLFTDILLLLVILAWAYNRHCISSGDALNNFRMVVCGGCAVEAVADFVCPSIHYRMLPMCRGAIFVAMHPQNVDNVVNCFRVVWSIGHIMVLVFLWILVFGWGGMLLFSGTPEGTTYFADWPTALSNMYYLMNTANMPDILMPAAKGNLGWLLYFTVYVLGITYLLLSVMLGTLYNNAAELMVNVSQKKWKANFDATNQEAFKALLLWQDSGKQTLSLGATRSFVKSVTRLTADDVDIAVRDLDGDRTGEIDITEFCALSTIVDYQVRNQSHFVAVQPIFALRDLVEHDLRNTLMDVVLFANIVIMMLQTQDMLISNSDAFAGHLETADEIFSLIFILESATRILGSGVEWYFSTVSNRIDFVSSILPPLAKLWCTSSFSGMPLANAQKIVMSTRLLRLARVVTERPMLEVYFATLRKIGGPVKTLGAPLVLLVYTFGVIGIYMFGGRILPAEIAPFNFDNWTNTMILMGVEFIITGVGILEGISQAAGSRWYRLYFVIFHTLASWVISAIFISFVVAKWSEEIEKSTKNYGTLKQVEGDEKKKGQNKV